MGFTANEPENPSPGTVSSSAFWPVIDLADVQAEWRIDGTVTTARLRLAVIEAVSTVNGELAGWRQERQQDGFATLAEVPGELLDGECEHLYHYRRAVGCHAKSELTRRYRDFDATRDGQQRADAMEADIDDLMRDARAAINRIKGRRGTWVVVAV
ncbi:glucose-6-phosphate isomerase [Laribacter hongkongensis]|uniref:head completion/stabilization protein n=1 Tax=Laribacter hongkongensis TaxID=168471 RepID=UPI000421D7FE|nr:head completion/stabilization protein [Laribacter hongkongensis]MBE5527434.1 glucose-6-phosphate isomerase [Laribacter hongkongensis]